MPNHRFFEVDVPIHNAANPALRRAHEVYDAALAAHTAGLEIPGKQPDSWGACGLRPGWELEWPAAKAGPWYNPLNCIRSDFAL